MLGEQGDAHGQGERQLVVAHLHGLHGGLLHLGRHALSALGVRARQQQHELVAAQARHGVALAHGALQAPGDLHQQGIAHAVAQRIVDMLEVVQVEEHHGQRRAVLLRQADGLLAPFGQQHAVGQLRQGVVVRHAVDALLVAAAVLDLALQPAHHGAVEQGPGMPLRVDVVDDPERAFAAVVRVDQPPRQVRPE
ncbi:hypothetical protein ALISP_1940 [Alicycliphilus sp. B1]|nr:hypothetical protein ALISP_1940 [Alicycliphilus sp. B1]